MNELGCHNVAASWDWGSVPEWLGGIATVAAVWFAAATYRRSENDKRKAQARLVHALLRDDLSHHPAGSTLHLPEYGEFDSQLMTTATDVYGNEHWIAGVECWSNTVEVHNGSNEVVSDVFGCVLEFGDPDSPLHHTDFGTQALRPGETSLHLVYFTSGPVGACAPPWQPRINFRDAANVEWERTMGAPVKESPFYTEPTMVQRIVGPPLHLTHALRAWMARR